MTDFLQVSEHRWVNMANVESVYDDAEVLSLFSAAPVVGWLGWMFGRNEEQFTGIVRQKILAYLAS